MNKYIDILYNLNKKAIINGDVPVSAILIYKDKIIAKAYNEREKKKNPLFHAEITAIQRATKKLKTWNLSECIMICSLKPCPMCSEVIKESRIKKVLFLLNNEKVISNNVNYEKIETNLNKKFHDQLTQFFIDKR